MICTCFDSFVGTKLAIIFRIFACVPRGGGPTKERNPIPHNAPPPVEPHEMDKYNRVKWKDIIDELIDQDKSLEGKIKLCAK